MPRRPWLKWIKNGANPGGLELVLRDIAMPKPLHPCPNLPKPNPRRATGLNCGLWTFPSQELGPQGGLAVQGTLKEDAARV